MPVLGRIAMILVSNPILSLILPFLLLILFSGSLIFLFEWLSEFDVSVIDSLFTAASAATVTGLTVVGTNELSFASQVTILATIQLGGLATILGSAFIILLARYSGTSFQGKSSAASLFGSALRDLGGILKFILIFTFVAEGLGTLLLFLHFQSDMESSRALWYAGFHAISAFCNAGFFLFVDDLRSFTGDAYVLAVMSAEITLGGIGFWVLMAASTKVFSRVIHRKRIYGWPVYSKVIVVTTLCLFLAGFVSFFSIEYDDSMSGLAMREKVLVSAFQSVSARTAGFSAVDMGQTASATQFLFMGLMFIGAGSVSTAGGIKTSTFSVLMLRMWANARRKRDVVVWNRVISRESSDKAIAVFVASFAILSTFVFVLLFLEKGHMDIFFEATSAFGTVGLSTGITSSLSDASRLLVSLLMVVGKVGPLSLMYIFGKNMAEEMSPYLREEIEVG